jgi:hypothetical protein
LAFKPPVSDLPSFLCHAGDLAIINIGRSYVAHA